MPKSNTKPQGKKTVFETMIYKSDGKIIKMTKLSPKKRLASDPKVYIKKVSSTNKVRKTEDYVTAKIAIKDHDYVVKQNIWPKLEISPGGIIKPSTVDLEPEPKIFSCGKCPQSFKFLYNLIEHVKSHDIKTKKNVIINCNYNLVEPVKSHEIENKEHEIINYCDVMELRDHGYVDAVCLKRRVLDGSIKT